MMKTKMRLILLLISGLIISINGVYRLLTEPVSFVPILFTLCGLVGVIGTLVDIKRKKIFSE